MSPSRALSVAFLTSALAAQSTWVVDPSGAGNFLSLSAAQTAAAPGDTLILRGQMPGETLTKQLNIVCQGSIVYTPLQVVATGPLSISGGTFEYVVFLGGNTASLDGITGTIRLQSGATVAARSCTLRNSAFLFQGAKVDAGARAVFDGCSFQGRSAAGLFGTVSGASGLAVLGHAELHNCAITGGANSVNPPVPGAPAIDLAGSVDLRNCVLTSAVGRALIEGSGIVRAQNTNTLGATPSPGTVTIVAAQLPWTTGTSAAPGGVLQAGVDGPPATLAVVCACLGMRAPTPTPFGDSWLDVPSSVLLAIAITDATGALNVTVPVPLQVQRGLQLTFQSIVVPGGGAAAATAPAILQIL